MIAKKKVIKSKGLPGQLPEDWASGMQWSGEEAASAMPEQRVHPPTQQEPLNTSEKQPLGEKEVVSSWIGSLT